jgi:hypothetical protein
MDTQERAEARPVPAAAHPNLAALLWAGAAYPVGAFLWACAAAGATATGAANGLLSSVEWFGWSLVWIVIITVGAAPAGLALAAAETFLWRLTAAHFRFAERSRLGLVLGSAVLALPWAFLVPWVLPSWLTGPWPGVIAFACAWLGFALPRLGLRLLRPGALASRPQPSGGTDEG